MRTIMIMVVRRCSKSREMSNMMALFSLDFGDACASAGFHEKGLEVALDIEQVLYEATTLLNAASLINRIARQS